MAAEPDVIFISMAARLLGMHPQTLRKYERLGLIRPNRTIGSMRLYSSEQLDRLKLIKHLVDERGINLAGVERLLSVAESVQRLQELAREDSLAGSDGRHRLTEELERLTAILEL